MTSVALYQIEVISSENILIITLFDTISLLGNEKSSKKEGLSPVTTRWGILRYLIQCNGINETLHFYFSD